MHDDDDFDGAYIVQTDYMRSILLVVTALFISVALLATGAYIGVVYVRHLQENIHRATPP